MPAEHYPVKENNSAITNPELLVVQLSGEITSLCRNNEA
ncbi:UNVERIFIED_ORG: hypothetical protein J2740_000110 [Rhizobium nepotum]|nr:hypothetical protein [Rhizobium nepotum]